ncbi:MAG TPA: hypothetical protein VNH18_14805 [Bryobacteraceae bacterium]|nr:hypothetical protein [Bryobacteraceae bacterium]
MAFHYQGRALLNVTPVLSKDGIHVLDVDYDGFLHLAKAGIVRLHGTKHKVHKLQLTVDMAQADPHEWARDPKLNKKYTREEHIGQRWYIHQLKMIPAVLRPDFCAVQTSVIRLYASA